VKKVKLKEGMKLIEPMVKPWKIGELMGFVLAGNNRPYAVVLTEHGEFELCPLYSIIEAKPASGKEEK